MNLYENVATQAIVTFFYQEPLWKKKILFDFLLEPFSRKYEDVQDVETQDNLKGTIPDFTIVLKDQRIKFEVKINNTGLTESERNKQNRDAFLVRRNYSHKDEIPLKDDKILYWEDLFEKIEKIGATNEFSRLTLVREYIHADNNSLHLTPLEVAMLYSPETISAVYSLSEKVLKLCEGFLETHKERYEYKEEQKDKYGIGYYFKDKRTKAELWIGISPMAEKAEYSFSICLSLNSLDSKDTNIKRKDDWHSKDGYAYFPLDKEILAKHEDDEKLQETFNKNVESVLNEIFSSKSKGAKSV